MHDVSELVFAQHAVIDEDAGEVFPDGAVEEYGGNGRIDASGESEDDAVVAELAFQFIDGGIDE